MTENRRTDSRLPVLWQAEIIDDHENRYPCVVRDISLAGMLISCEHNFPLNSELLIEIRELGDFAGAVRWCGDNAIGFHLIAGDDLALKKFAIAAGADLSRKPEWVEDF